MVWLRKRCVPQRHDLVADVLVDQAVPLEDELAHLVEVVLDDSEHVVRAHRLRHRCEASDVHEHHRELAALTLRDQLVHRARGRQLLSDPRVDVVTEDALHLAPLAFFEHVASAERRDRGQDDRDRRVQRVRQVAKLSEAVDRRVVQDDETAHNDHAQTERKQVDQQANQESQESEREPD